MVFDLNVKELSWLILSAAPVFLVGIIEDLGYSMSPKARIFASIISSFVALLFFKVWLSNLGIFGLDTYCLFLLELFLLSSPGGAVNAFNLIDGLNGLSSYVSVSIAVSLSIIAFQVNKSSNHNLFGLNRSCVIGFAILIFLLARFLW